MNTITASRLTDFNDVDFGQVYERDENYYIVTSDDSTGRQYLLINLRDGSLWANPQNKNDMIEDLVKSGFRKFTGQLTINVK